MERERNKERNVKDLFDSGRPGSVVLLFQVSTIFHCFCGCPFLLLVSRFPHAWISQALGLACCSLFFLLLAHPKKLLRFLVGVVGGDWNKIAMSTFHRCTHFVANVLSSDCSRQGGNYPRDEITSLKFLLFNLPQPPFLKNNNNNNGMLGLLACCYKQRWKTTIACQGS